MRFEESIEIDASPQMVWDVLSDIAAWPARIETVDVAELVTPAPVAKGSRVRLKQPKLPEGIWDITVWDPPSYFEMSQRSGGVSNVAGHRVEAVADGRARLTLSVEMQGWLVPVVGLLSKGMTTRYLASEAQDMKRAAESAAT